MFHSMCRVHKPGVPRGPAFQQRLGPSRQRATHGLAQVSERQARRMIHSPTGRPGRGGTAPVFRLRPTSPIGALPSVSSPPPDGLSDQKAWPDTAFDSHPCLRPGMRQTPAHYSSSTDAIGADWNQPTGDVRLVRTRKRTEKVRQGAQVEPQYQEPYPVHLPSNTLRPSWHNRTQVVL